MIAPTGFDEVLYACTSCLDELSGLRQFWCRGEGPHKADYDARPPRHDGLTMSQCGRRQDHPDHAYADRCECWRTNPTIQARHQRAAEAKQRPERPRRTR